MSYSEELDFVTKAPDERFPEFLFNPSFNDFGDNYYQQSKSENDAKEIRGLRRKYSNFFDYIDAIRIYNRYMDKMIEKYGGIKIIKNCIKEDLISDYIPPKPKLKMNRRNKEFLRCGIIPSRVLIKERPSAEEYKELARKMQPTATGQTVEDYDPYAKLPKSVEKAVKLAAKKFEQKQRLENMYCSTGTDNGSDFIVEYLNNASKGHYTTIGEYKEESILDIVKDEERRSMIPEEILMAEENYAANKTRVVNGRLVYAREQEKIELMENLYQAGIDVLGVFRKNMDRKTVKMVRSRIGLDDDERYMTKKELRQYKKRMKQERKRMEKRRDNDRILSETLLANKIDLGRSGDSMNLRLSDLLR